MARLRGLDRVAEVNRQIAAQGNKGYAVAPSGNAYNDATKLAQQAAAMIGGSYSPSGGFVSSYSPPPVQTASQPLKSSSVLKPGGMALLNTPVPNISSKLPSGTVPQVYSGSTGSGKDYTAPVGQYTPPLQAGTNPDILKIINRTSAPQTSVPPPPVSTQYTNPSPISRGFTALKNIFSRGDSSQGGVAINPNNQFNQPSQSATTTTPTDTSTSQPPATTTPTIDTGVAQTAPPQSQVKSKFDDQYELLANDTTSDSGTMQKNLDAIKAQDTAEKQARLQQLQTELAQRQAQLAALQAAEQPVETQPAIEGQVQPTSTFNPEGQSQISALSAQIRAMEEEIARVQEDSPSLTAATEALNKKIAEEAMIKANLNQGITNVQDQPIAQSFITGQSAALERQANAALQTNAAMRIPLQQQLATEQAKKQTALDVVKTKYGNLADERKRFDEIYKTNYQRANTVADKKQAESTKYTEVSPGATLYNPSTNQAVYTAPTKPTSTKSASTSSITKLKNALNDSKFRGAEADGKYADPNLYLANYNSYPDKAEFLRLFPPATYINPANTFLPQEIMQFVKKSTGGRTV